MSRDRDQEVHALLLRDQAAVPVLARIRRHGAQAPVSQHAVFAALERHIFDRGFNVNQLCRACGEDAANISTRFSPVVGMTPGAYIASCRLETAWSLILNTDLKVWEIADVVGYRSSQVFTDAFHRWYGLRPTAYHKQFERMTDGRDRDEDPNEASEPDRQRSGKSACARPPSVRGRQCTDLALRAEW